MMKNIKCAVFDLDGTLLNTIKTINHYLNYALSTYGLPAVSEADCKSFVGDGAVLLIRRAMARVGADDSQFQGLFKTYNDAYDSDPYYLTEPYPGIREMLAELKSEGIILAVLSNKPDFAVRMTVEHFFPGIFSSVLGAGEGIALKPDPTALLNMLADLGVTPADTAYVGDSEPDVLTAANASVALPVAVSWGFRTREQLLSAGAENIIGSPKELLY